MSVTVFIGAGAAIDLGGPSTNQITKYLRCCNTVFGGTPLPIFERIGKILDDYYEYKVCNFEEIFFILELLETYYHAQSRGIRNEFKAPFAPFIEIERAIADIFKDYPNEPPHTHSPAVFLSQAKSDAIKIIAGMIQKYNALPKEDWFINFWRNTLNNDSCDIATLNYDTSIEDTLTDLEDGYEKTDYGFKKFNPALINGSKSTILHLHGCINLGYGKYDDRTKQYLENHREDLFKYDSFAEAHKHWDIRIEATAQSTEQTIIGPIITGLRKTDKLIAFPYSYYNYWLTRAISVNKNLLIIGYSFGDLHFNTTLERISNFHKDCRIVLIDFRNFSGLSKKDGDYDKVIFNSIHVLRLFSKILKDYNPQEVIKNFDLENGEPVISNDGNTRIYFGGFKNTVERFGDDIIRFLNA